MQDECSNMIYDLQVVDDIKQVLPLEKGRHMYHKVAEMQSTSAASLRCQ